MKDIFLVDADDTLLDFHGVSETALKEAFVSSKLTWKEEYLQEYKRINDGLWQALERKELSRTELMDRRFHIYLSALGLGEADADSFNREYIRILSTRPVYIDGAEDFLKALKEKGKVYIVTNGTAEIQKSRFTIGKLYEKTDGVFVSQEAGYDKPDRRYTDYVIERIPHFKKERAVWIGDSLTADVKAAQDAGITSIWYNPHKKAGNGKIFADYQAENYQEILDILHEIQGN